MAQGRRKGLVYRTLTFQLVKNFDSSATEIGDLQGGQNPTGVNVGSQSAVVIPQPGRRSRSAASGYGEGHGQALMTVWPQDRASSSMTSRR